MNLINFLRRPTQRQRITLSWIAYEACRCVSAYHHMNRPVVVRWDDDETDTWATARLTDAPDFVDRPLKLLVSPSLEKALDHLELVYAYIRAVVALEIERGR